jgi:hypothetical protein
VERAVKVKELKCCFISGNEIHVEWGLKMPISPERQRIAKIFKTHIDKAIEELGVGYNVTLQGKFDKTPIHIEIQVDSRSQIP